MHFFLFLQFLSLQDLIISEDFSSNFIYAYHLILLTGQALIKWFI